MLLYIEVIYLKKKLNLKNYKLHIKFILNLQ